MGTNAKNKLNILADEHHTRADLKMIERAQRQGWGISQKRRAAVVSKMSELVEKATDNRTKVGAAKVLVQADAINVKREQLAQKDEHHAAGQTLHVDHSGGLVVGVLRDTVINDPRYLEYLRSKAIAGNGDAGPVGAIDHEGRNGSPAVANGEAHSPPGPGNNGHANGNGRH